MKKSLAIVGTGIAGMGCAHKLQHEYDITLFEKNDYIGGHTNTIAVPEGDKMVYFDTGFMVFNYETYPNLIALFDEIKAEVKKTDMSFSVQHLPTGLEYCGSGIAGLFAQRKNIFNIGYIKMLLQIGRFNKESVVDLENPKYDNHSLQAYLNEKGFADEMRDKYLIPMSAAVWSTPMELMMEFPAKTLIRFFYNHGFLGLDTQHQWYTPENGSQQYREKLIAPFRDKIHVNAKVNATSNNGDKIVLHTEKGDFEFDKVIFAGHADDTVEILGNTATELEKRLLPNFKYQKNIATVHTDESMMPKNKKVWSAWNYRMRPNAEGKLLPSTIYWMNKLQGVSDKVNYFVNVNGEEDINPNKIIRTIEYHHPLFDVPAIQAQAELHKLNEQGTNRYYCGSYFKYGFHEDAYKSGVECAKAILSVNSRQ